MPSFSNGTKLFRYFPLAPERVTFAEISSLLSLLMPRVFFQTPCSSLIPSQDADAAPCLIPAEKEEQYKGTNFRGAKKQKCVGAEGSPSPSARQIEAHRNPENRI